jgi:hypothetical protein
MYRSQVLKIADATRGFAQRLTGWRVFSTDDKKTWPIVSQEIDEPAGNESYTTAWLELMSEAIRYHEINVNNQPKAETLRIWFETRMAGSRRVSRNLAKAMATFVRPPELMEGGLKPFARREPTMSRAQTGASEVSVGKATSERTM